MDSTDKEILAILEENSRTPYTEIAERLNVSEGTVRNRIKSLEEGNIIERYTVETDLQGQTAIVTVNVETDTDFSELFSKLPEDIQLFEVAGDHDIVLKFSRESTEELNQVVDTVRMLKEVRSTTTYPVLKKREK